MLWALLAWGNRHFAPEGASVIVVDTETGEVAEPVLVDRRSGKVMAEPEFRSVPGPAAEGGVSLSRARRYDITACRAGSSALPARRC